MGNEIHTGLDFDGTATELERGFLPYGVGYKRDLANHLGITEDELERMWKAVTDEILAAPGDYGWKDEGTGKIMAPATADPMLLTRETASQLLERLKTDPEKLGFSPARVLSDKVPQDSAARHQLLETFFHRNHSKIEAHFRPGAADFLRELVALGRLTIVTNSGTKSVLKKLAELREKDPTFPEIEVRGDAKKCTLTPDWTMPEMPTELDCKPHLIRPVYTQRGRYYGVLEGSGFMAAKSRVFAGDVWEMDLMLPMLLGVKGAYITRPTTPEHEKAIVTEEVRRGRARISHNLEGLLSDIRELHQA